MCLTNKLAIFFLKEMPKITLEEMQVCDERNLKIFEIGSQQHGEK